jgi:hypothetical protein
LGLSEDIAGKVILYLAGKDGQRGTEDDNFFVSAPEIALRLSQAYPFTPPQIEELERVAALLGVSSDNFMVRSTASLNDRYSLTVTSAVTRQGRILYWREN